MSIQKTVIINRAVPGSGKTTISNCILDSLKDNNLEIAIHSTDKYFMTIDGKYDFKIDKLYDNHQKNLYEFTKSLMTDTKIVICDNTNIAPWQTKSYTELAREYDYKIIFITFDPRELEKHVEAQTVTKEKPDAHGVSEEILKDMIVEYQLYDSLLDNTAKINPVTQLDYQWNIDEFKKEPNGKASTYFELDDCIRILPNEYQEIQKTIGDTLIKLIFTNKESLDE